MKPENLAEIRSYLNEVSRASSELAKKERFKSLLERLFGSDARIRAVIDQMSFGAEKTVANIPLADRTKSGRSDTQYNNVIIEFERDIARQAALLHAQEQLAEYVQGNWQSGERYDFTLIATDCVRWKVFAPNYEYLLTHALSISADALKEVASFTLSADNAEEFFYFLDRFLFRTELQRATLEGIALDFGESSGVFLTAMRTMEPLLQDLQTQSHLYVAYDQWLKFLSVAYGSFDDSDERKRMFFVHTYLSAFAKILAFRVLSKKPYLDDVLLQSIIGGEAFEPQMVRHFVEDDFFHWITEAAYFQRLKPVFRIIAAKIEEYDFTNVQEDILKGVYQELIDLETRHALGEYYTPDWLCERVIHAMPITERSRILDPACGSGSFLRAAVAHLRTNFPGLSASDIAKNVVGIDIHPLSVQIAKTTMLLALGELLQTTHEPITLGVHLANSLLVAEGTMNLYESEFFNVRIDETQCSVDVRIFDMPEEFDSAINLCETLAEETQNQADTPFPTFAKHLRKRALQSDPLQGTTESYYAIYKALKVAKEQQRDSIWKFILQNLYKPLFLREQFDIVVGNPPWLTYSGVSNVAYQRLLFDLAAKYHIIPQHQANMPHLEIAAIFLAHTASYFLKTGKHLAFVLPRSFLTADQHDNTRSGNAKDFKITGVWDLQGVEPLFRVPSCVIFAQEARTIWKGGRKIPANGGIEGFAVQGRVRKHHAHWHEVSETLTFQPTRWFYSVLSASRTVRSALTQEQSRFKAQPSPYAALFKQGATIVPRSFYFVEADRRDIHGNPLPPPPDKELRGRKLPFKTDTAILRDAKAPWKSLTLTGTVNTDYLFRTAISKNILPFALVNPPLVLLPVQIQNTADGAGKQTKILTLITDTQLHDDHSDFETAEWFGKAVTMWDSNKTEKSGETGLTLYKRLDYQRGLTEQNLNTRYLVLYTSSAQDASAVVVDRQDFGVEFLVDHKAYWYATGSVEEAWYLTSYLNSGYANHAIKEFQSRGLFGARDIHKKILELPLPKFSATKPDHKQLAELSEVCHQKALATLGDTTDMDLNAHALGQLRRVVRTALAEPLAEIDVIVERLLTAKRTKSSD